MTVTADHIRGTLDDYLDVRPHDTGQLVDLLELLDASADLTSRKEFRGHVTAGAILVDPAGRVLHVRHVALNRWLLPGGHLEANDISLLAAAQRELSEETGIPAAVVVPAGNRPVHIEAHLIPANPAKGEPDHQHFDFRFLGGFNRSSQHLVNSEVWDGSSSAGGRSGGAPEVEVTGASEISASYRGGVLGRNCQGASRRGSGWGYRRGAGGGHALVPAMWGHATVRSTAAFG